MTPPNPRLADLRLRYTRLRYAFGPPLGTGAAISLLTRTSLPLPPLRSLTGAAINLLTAADVAKAREIERFYSTNIVELPGDLDRLVG